MVRRVCNSALASAGTRGALLFAAFAVLSSAACNKPKRNESAGGKHAKLAPLEAPKWLVDLEVEGFGKAALAVPLGATSPRPIVIALHGVADRPEWTCTALRGIAGSAPFVLCPRGVQRRDMPIADARYTFGTADDAKRELRAALAALKQRFGAYVAAGPVVSAGFEIGADHLAWIAREEPAFFSRLLLIEPSVSSWPSSQAALFGRGGGQRVLFAFGPAHRDELEQKAVLTNRSGAEGRALFLGEGTPSLNGATAKLLAAQWAWLSAPAGKAPIVEDLAGNALPAHGPTLGRPAQ